MGNRQPALSALSLSLSLAAAGSCSSTPAGADAGGGGAGDVPRARPDLVWAEAAPCPLARFEANGVVVADELWVLGGFVSSTLEVTRRVDIYRPATDTW